VPRAEMSDLLGEEAAYNAERLRRILEGEPGAQADFVALNAAAGLLVGGKVDDLQTGYELAKSLLAAGSAVQTLDRFLAVSQRLSAG
ncbi:anthranilate phosphoribosyltransferase, partial [Sutterella massiliensis]|nr:anthranilate phosphoribosyltransferase [Sutterella massiliensis]